MEQNYHLSTTDGCWHTEQPEDLVIHLQTQLSQVRAFCYFAGPLSKSAAEIVEYVEHRQGHTTAAIVLLSACCNDLL